MGPPRLIPHQETDEIRECNGPVAKPVFGFRGQRAKSFLEAFGTENRVIPETARTLFSQGNFAWALPGKGMLHAIGIDKGKDTGKMCRPPSNRDIRQGLQKFRPVFPVGGIIPCIPGGKNPWGTRKGIDT